MAAEDVLRLVIAALCTVLGYVAARSIVAEANAHRLDRPDRWWDPECEECDGGLSSSMLTCRSMHHRQRRANAWIIVATMVVFGLVGYTVDSLWVLPAYLWFAYFLVLLTVTDLDTKLIPNRILLPGTIGGLVLLGVGSLAAGSLDALLRGLVSGVGYFVVMLILGLLARGALGFGDVKLAFLLGVFTGYLGWGQVVMAGLGSFILGGLVALVLVVTRRASRKDAIPFGPFMTTAAIVAVVVGNVFLDWYLG